MPIYVIVTLKYQITLKEKTVNTLTYIAIIAKTTALLIKQPAIPYNCMDPEAIGDVARSLEALVLLS